MIETGFDVNVLNDIWQQAKRSFTHNVWDDVT